MSNTLAVMLTMTTYGTWLRGDARGWVDGGIVFPAAPALEAEDRRRMKHPTFRFEADQWWPIGRWMGISLQDRLAVRVRAMTVQTWHVHVVVGATAHPVGRVVKCAKDAVRWGLRPGRPIWSAGYDKRFCYDEASVRRHIAYVERHNVEADRPAKPWAFLHPPNRAAPGV